MELPLGHTVSSKDLPFMVPILNPSVMPLSENDFTE